ncbi:MAG: hypothetical protein K2X27_25805 [Candidatus Obscuribacterales bacterium]|nr:hypothetical protein [Candidatus Obscuribacterales bacterium]
MKMMIAGMDFSGFLSAELIPPEQGGHTEWKLLQRFRLPEHLSAWRESERRLSLLKEISAETAGAENALLLHEETSKGEQGSVATAIVTRVKAGMEASYRNWEAKVQLAQAKIPGYRGSYLQPPTGDVNAVWTTLLRFDTPESLEMWFNCEERKVLLAEGTKYVDSVDFQQLSNSFPGWFPTDPKTGKGPPPYKTFMLILLSLFPIVMFEIKFLMPLMHDVNGSLANFIGNVLSVAATTWITVPAAIKAFDWWILPLDNERKQSTELKGILIICLIYVFEIALLWRFLS